MHIDYKKGKNKWIHKQINNERATTCYECKIHVHLTYRVLSLISIHIIFFLNLQKKQKTKNKNKNNKKLKIIDYQNACAINIFLATSNCYYYY
jgi:hypothetical protein